MWENRSPLSFQAFHNYNFGKWMISQTYRCKQWVEWVGRVQKCSDQLRCVDRLLDNCIRIHCHSVILSKTDFNLTLFPNRYQNRKCAMLFVSNLATPEWVSIKCHTRLLRVAYCSWGDKEDTDLQPNVSDTSTCHLDFIRRKTSCLKLFWLWISGSKSLVHEYCENMQLKIMYDQELDHLDFLVDAVSAIFPPLLLQMKNTTFFYLHTFSKMFNTVKHRKVLINPKNHTENREGFLGCKTGLKPSRSRIGDNMKRCSNEAFISSVFVCDGELDCKTHDKTEDTSDEFCLCNENGTDRSKSCSICKKGDLMCSSLQYKAVTGKCEGYLSNNFQVSNEKNNGGNGDKEKQFFCNSGRMIESNLVNDLIPDCEFAEDELLLTKLLSSNQQFKCPFPDEIPCFQGHTKCFKIIEICKFSLNAQGFLRPCRSGGHLDNCKQFECNSQFKCPDSYCIPWGYICDGKWDCPFGIDESRKTYCNKNMYNTKCASMFKCKGTIFVCVHLNDVCNGFNDCPKRDDEMLCELQKIQCPAGCHCLGFAVSCCSVSFPKIFQSNIFPYVSLFAEWVAEINLDKMFTLFPNISFVKLHGNELTSNDTCQMILPKSLHHLSVERNRLVCLTSYCFMNSVNLKILSLSSNQITHVETSSFVNLPALSLLKLDGNPIVSFSKAIISDYGNPEGLFVLMKNVNADQVHPQIFQGLSLQGIITSDYHIGCVVKRFIICTSKIPWYVSCSQLIPGPVMKGVFITFSVSIFVVCVAWIKTVFPQNNSKSTSFLVCVFFKNLNNLMSGIYLFIMWVADKHFGDMFATMETVWRSSLVCFVASGMMLFFHFFSGVLHVFFALLRFMIVEYPIDTKFKEVKFVARWIMLLFSVCLVLSLSVSAVLGTFIPIIPTIFCVPFLDPGKEHLISPVLAWGFVVFVLIALYFGIALHFSSIYSYHQSQRQIKKSKVHDKTRVLIVQLTLLSVLNVLSWLPLTIIYLVDLFGYKYSAKLVHSTLASSLLSHSVLYPLVLLFFTSRGKK